MQFSIRKANPEEFSTMGQMIVEVYRGLQGMPGVEEQPEYYQMFSDVASRVRRPSVQVWTAVGVSGEILGSVDFIEDMGHYGSGGNAGALIDGAGIRLLAVRPESRGLGLGRALTQFCINDARRRGRASVYLHTSKAMQTAWGMYEKMGFERFSGIDFQQGELEVFGLKLDLKRNEECH